MKGSYEVFALNVKSFLRIKMAGAGSFFFCGNIFCGINFFYRIIFLPGIIFLREIFFAGLWIIEFLLDRMKDETSHEIV